WQNEGVLVRDEEPAAWVVSQDYVGPDGVARTRTGIVASLRAEPYETRAVLPHERTHRGPKEGRLRLLRATGVQLEPIFLLPHPPRVGGGPGGRAFRRGVRLAGGGARSACSGAARPAAGRRLRRRTRRARVRRAGAARRRMGRRTRSRGHLVHARRQGGGAS